MATTTQIIDAKWYYQHKNGDDFSLLPSDYTQNLVGNIFENVKLVATVRSFTTVDADKIVVKTDSIYVPNAQLTKSISVGDTVRLFFSGNISDNTVVLVDSISDEIIYYTSITPPATPIPFTATGGDSLIVESPLTYLRYDHGLTVSTNSTTNYRSKLDGETTSYIVPNLTGVFSDGEKTAINSNFGSFKARFVGVAQIPYDNVGSFNSAQDFEIEHIFKIQDYSEADIQNYIDRFKPDAYLGESTLNYNSKFEFRNVETAPSTSKIGTFLDQSNVGYFGENLNGRPNNYTVSDVVIVRVSNNSQIEDITSSEASKVTFNINGDFTSEAVIVLNHFAMISDYEFKKVDFEDLFFSDTVRIQGISTENGGIITEGKITAVTPTQASVEMTVNPNSSTLDGEQYLLSVLVGDSSIPSITSNKVQEIIKTGFYQTGFDIEGLLGDVSIELFQRDCDPYTEVGSSSFSIISGELIYTKLLIPTIGGLIDSIELETIDLDGVDGIEVVDSDEIDTSSFVTVNGEQEIQTDLPTPYRTGLNGRIEKVSTGLYQVVFPYRLPYEKLRKVLGLSSVLFDQNEPNQGLNESVHYQATKGLDIHIAYKIGMLSEGRITYYRYRTPPLTIKDFEENT